MEMVQTVAQLKESASTMPGMLSASATTAAPVAPSLFAALLREMLPTAPAGAGTQGAVSQTGTVPGDAMGTGKISFKFAPVTEEAGSGTDEGESAPDGDQLVQMLAAACQAAGFQSLPQPDSKPVAVSEPAEVLAAAGEVTGAPGSPVFPQLAENDNQAKGGSPVGASMLSLPESHLPQDMPAAPHVAQAGPVDNAAQMAAPFGVAEQTGTEGAQVKYASPTPPVPENPAEAQPGNTPSRPADNGANRRPDAEQFLAGRGLLIPGEREPQPQDAGTAGDSSAVGVVERVFAGLAGKGGAQARGENDESGAREGRRENLPDGVGAVAPRPFALPESNRPALQSNAAEAKNALHESIMAQVSEGVVRHDGKGNGQMTVRLNPQELGDLQINVRVEAQRVKVEVISDNLTVREALVGNLDNLKETLSKQNLNMEGFAVSTGGGGSNGFSQPFREEGGNQRDSSRITFGRETGSPDVSQEKSGVVWGAAESSLVDLRL
jgi:hypothetical protein